MRALVLSLESLTECPGPFYPQGILVLRTTSRDSAGLGLPVLNPQFFPSFMMR